MYKNFPRSLDQIKPRLKLDKIFFWNPLSSFIETTWNTKMSEGKPETQQSIFDKRTQPKTKKRKTPDKIEQKLNTKRDTAQRDSKLSSLNWLHRPVGRPEHAL